ncbi:LAMI_0F04610g1_1 [Lachancea mirantina]|uniref:LAMI_0F04610g1_1 n=1 Tax=Lachancea mirantina TaxID=1230905 RepID=A0A1G4JXT2_9SACH|nr:LAMI_0F04610g1_1 [Lachancea mirantina]
MGVADLIKRFENIATDGSTGSGLTNTLSSGRSGDAKSEKAAKGDKNSEHKHVNGSEIVKDSVIAQESLENANAVQNSALEKTPEGIVESATVDVPADKVAENAQEIPAAVAEPEHEKLEEEEADATTEPVPASERETTAALDTDVNAAESSQDPETEMAGKPENSTEAKQESVSGLVEASQELQELPAAQAPSQDNSATSSKKSKKKNKKKKKNGNAGSAGDHTTSREVSTSETSQLLGSPNASEKETQDVSTMDEDLEAGEAESLAHEDLSGSLKNQAVTGDTRIGRDDPFQFGQRKLNEESDVWDHNAWDNVEWGEEQILAAEEKIAEQHKSPVSDFDKELYNGHPERYWDIFYKNNRENFFKDRKWLQIEFPSLYESTKKDAGAITIFEIGCGAGNTLYPILSENKNDNLKLIGADFSPRAVELVKTNPNFDPKFIHATVWDLANKDGALPEGVEPHSVDIAVMVFVFSALAPEQWAVAVQNLHKLLKPGGKILFRDYGRYDLAQVRFKKNRLLDDNFYIRGDGTRVYFFTEEELRNIFTENKYFEENRIGTDRRLLVNRKRQLKMYRVWLQAAFDVPI